MKKVLSLTESELIKVINRIVESYSDDVYNDEDYVEVFFHYFRPWVKKGLTAGALLKSVEIWNSWQKPKKKLKVDWRRLN